MTSAAAPSDRNHLSCGICERGSYKLQLGQAQARMCSSVRSSGELCQNQYMQPPESQSTFQDKCLRMRLSAGHPRQPGVPP